jgi:hypothetical protein
MKRFSAASRLVKRPCFSVFRSKRIFIGRENGSHWAAMAN